MSATRTIRAYADLARIHFAPVWPLLFASGAVLAYAEYGGFAWWALVRIALIGLFGFEAGMIFNDYVDRDLDKRDVETNAYLRYWRPFNSRPLSTGALAPQTALLLAGLCALAALVLIATLGMPCALYVAGIMAYAYGMEYFYQVKKRHQRFPAAQLLGRTDFALFPVAGYLCAGRPDLQALLYFVFFYPLALTHLGLNDLGDARNDEARHLATVPVLYGVRGTVRWIAGFSLLHAAASIPFITLFDSPARFGILAGLALLAAANYIVLSGQAASAGRTAQVRGAPRCGSDAMPECAVRALPFFHAAMLTYLLSIFADFFVSL
jgi:4-hydroxybenzoate polyprenyltransferase